MSITMLARVFPPVRRLHDSIRQLQALVARLSADHDRLATEVAHLQAAAPPPAVRPSPTVPLHVLPGHYYSPIVDPAELRRQGFGTRRKLDRLEGVEIDFGAMERLFRQMIEAYGDRHLPEHADRAQRYYASNDMYGVGDATVLAALLRHLRPQRWIEVGSGFSSAVLLDTLDRTPGLNTRLTFIEPNPERLDLLLRDADRAAVTIIRSAVQAVPLDTFDALAAGDVLFLDTTHIAKTGSDVVHEVFQILPRLASGVVVHFHDVFADFDYPEPWIFSENRSWNELYLLRAFLMYNARFEILYANDAFAQARPDVVQSLCPAILSNPGGGFWMRKR